MTAASRSVCPRPPDVRLRLIVGAVLLLGLLATALVPVTGSAQAVDARDRAAPAAPVTPTSTDVNAWLDGLVPGLLDAHEAAGGVAVSVVSGGETVAVRGYGAADADRLTREATPLNGERHLVRIGSISKTFTGIAVLQLVEAGRLDLDADVRTYLDFPLETPRGAVTLRHLLSHTAGFEERLAHLDAATAEEMLSLRDVVAIDPPVQIFAPGVTPAYSNYGNDLAGYIVEKVAGVPFEEYVDIRILRPLGMTSTTARQPLPESLASRMASGFAERGRAPGGFEFINSRPAGSITASAPDMARYMNALLGHGGGEAISPAIRAHLIDAAPMAGVGSLAKAGYVSLSFHHEDLDGRAVLGHGGDTTHFHSQMSIVPGEDLGIFVSMTGGAKADVREEIERAFLRRYVAPLPAWQARPDGSAQRADAVAGTWTFTRRSETTFAGLLTQAVRVQAGENGDIDALGETWREVEPWVWQNDAGTHRIAARVGPDGAVEQITPTGYFSTTPGGPLASNEQAVVLGVALGVLAVAMICLAAVGVRRRRRRRRSRDGASETWPRSRLGRVAAWVPLAPLVAVGSIVVLVWPLLQGDLATPLPVLALRVAQIALVLTGVGVVVIVAHLVVVARQRRILPALGWVIVGASATAVLVLAATAGVLRFDATY